MKLHSVIKIVPCRIRMLNIWRIVYQISKGLEFVNSNSHTGGDLKIANDMSPFVLYSHLKEMWKIPDFGLTIESRSKNASKPVIAEAPTAIVPRNYSPRMRNLLTSTYGHQTAFSTTLITGKKPFLDDLNLTSTPYQSQRWKFHIKLYRLGSYRMSPDGHAGC